MMLNTTSKMQDVWDVGSVLHMKDPSICNMQFEIQWNDACENTYANLVFPQNYPTIWRLLIYSQLKSTKAMYSYYHFLKFLSNIETESDTS